SRGRLPGRARRPVAILVPPLPRLGREQEDGRRVHEPHLASLGFPVTGQRSVAMTGAVDASAAAHLLRVDGQEDLCFALWYPSRGSSRATALVERLILPRDGERNVHGNVSFGPAFLERALG